VQQVEQTSSSTSMTLSYLDQDTTGTLSGNTATSGGDIYTGLDRFDRVVDQYWFDSSDDILARYQYSYDNDGNVLFKHDLTADGTSFSAVYTYDGLDRLTSYTQGTFNTSNDSISGTPTASESWGFDTYGNWNELTVNGVETSNTTNSQNELTSFNSSSQTFDNNGNTLSGSTGMTYTYNAWNEMASAKSGSVTVDYTYDALGQRIGANTSTGSVALQYYSADGQVIETDTSGDGTGSAVSQYVWGLAYVNDLVARDDNSTGGDLGVDSSGLGRRVFAITDANYDVTGIVSTGNAVLERFGYTPYGTRTVMNSSYGSISDSYSFQVGFQGGLMDSVTGLVHFGARDYDSFTGRWMQQDPKGYINGANKYQLELSSPIGRSDPSGENAVPQTPLMLAWDEMMFYRARITFDEGIITLVYGAQQILDRLWDGAFWLKQTTEGTCFAAPTKELNTIAGDFFDWYELNVYTEMSKIWRDNFAKYDFAFLVYKLEVLRSGLL
jgi:RHS repeat-associated protein